MSKSKSKSPESRNVARVIRTKQRAKLEPRIPTHEEESFGRHNIQLSEFLGTKIASSQFPTRESTKGLYLRVRNTETVVALTCRHVVFGQEEENVDFCRDTNNTRSVLQPGNKTYQDTMGNLHEAISWINSSLRCYKSPTEKQLEHEMHFEGQAREKPTAI
ncbi:hypothetical protein FOXB_14333 [Fusarium oxysporum f. sp. conglutinans Fo5176]|uniref:Uncharacterized protein n=1 Tax=Fusarium oxysporum (strain Fo5176) TaxID=660025 RepID=F9G6Q1_FUSOF|nr:hypothetical protein FOXB_14333 [Fusarium oxysporum f. sp. conglutinans Fo5176]